MGRRKVRIVQDENGEVVSIRWRVKEHRIKPGFREAMTKDPCVYCGNPSESWEHIKPKVKGGKDGWSNIARACFRCNRTRGCHPLLYYMVTKDAGSK